MANGGELARILSSGELPVELVLESLDFLLFLELLFAEGFTGGELVFFEGDSEEFAAFPALVRALVIGLNQRQAALRLAGRAFDFH